jgi:hypothetical protein
MSEARPNLMDDSRRDAPRDDRVLRPTRWLAAFITPFLVVAVAILYFFPEQTDRHWSWTIQATMTSMMLASAYFAGIYFFTRALFASQWHHVKLGFLPVATFAATLGVATIIHWDRFRHDHIAFILWAGLYFTAPFLVFFAWLNNRGRDPGVPDADDVEVPRLVRWLAGALGLALVGVGLWLFLVPSVGVETWPWSLTPLTARVIAAILALTGVAGLGIALDRRWSSSRIVFEDMALTLILILVATARAWSEFDQASPFTWVFTVFGTLFLVGVVALYLRQESLRRRAQHPSRQAARE